MGELKYLAIIGALTAWFLTDHLYLTSKLSKAQLDFQECKIRVEQQNTAIQDLFKTAQTEKLLQQEREKKAEKNIKQYQNHVKQIMATTGPKSCEDWVKWSAVEGRKMGGA